jgi:hypothetical protein
MRDLAALLEWPMSVFVVVVSVLAAVFPDRLRSGLDRIVGRNALGWGLLRQERGLLWAIRFSGAVGIVIGLLFLADLLR